MVIMNKIWKYIKKPKLILIYLFSKNYFWYLPDKIYLKMLYKLKMGRKLNLNNPQTFNEKMQWLKLYDRKPEYTKMVDKYEAKKYVSEIIGEEYIIPTLGIYDTFEEINFEKLPNQFVIKCTHDSGGNVICKDKEKFCYGFAKKKIKKYLKRNYYDVSKEWPYKNVRPRIIIEKYMATKEQPELIDYKFFCFGGKVKIILVCSERSKKLKETWFDTEWNYINLKEGFCETDKSIKKPTNLKLMIELSEKLSKKIAFVRIDFYEINEKIYFSEITFFPKSGYEQFEPKEYNNILGDMIKLPYTRKKFK